MCVVSMIMEHKTWEWEKLLPGPTYPLPYPYPYQPSPTPLITSEEVEEFRRLLERAREYDKKMGQPDCELDQKRKKLKELAELIGVEIEFV